MFQCCLGRLTLFLRQRWCPLGMLAILLAGSGALAAPHLWAWHHLRAAQADLERYHAEDAQAHLSCCLKVWSGNAYVHFLASRADRQAGAYEQAEAQLRECERLQKGPSPQTKLEWALLHAAAGDLDTVEEYLQVRAAREPAQAPLIWEALCEGYVRMYRITEALECLEPWLEREPDNPQALFLRAKVYFQVKSLGQAVPDYRRVVQLDPARDDARWPLALCLLEIGRYEESLAHLEYLRPRRPEDLELRVRLASCLTKLGRWPEAQEELDVVLAVDPNNGLALRTRGELAHLKANLPEAEKWLRAAIRVLPYDYHATWFLYETLREEGKTDEAQAQLAHAQDLKDHIERLGEVSTRKMSSDPRNPALHCEMGTLLISLGHQDIGERWLFTALQLDPNYAPAHAALADYYEQHGQPEKAALQREQAHRAALPRPGATPAWRPEF